MRALFILIGIFVALPAYASLTFTPINPELPYDGHCLSIVEYEFADDVEPGADLYDFHWQVRDIFRVIDLTDPDEPEYFRVIIGHISAPQESLVSPEMETKVILGDETVMELWEFEDYLIFEYKE